MKKAGQKVNKKRAKRWVAYQEVRRRQAEQGWKEFRTPTLPNRKSDYRSKEEEQENRQRVVEEKIEAFQAILPGLLAKLARSEDPREPKKVKRKITVVLLFGILIFVLQMESRREVTREMSRPGLWETFLE